MLIRMSFGHRPHVPHVLERVCPLFAASEALCEEWQRLVLKGQSSGVCDCGICWPMKTSDQAS